MPSEGGNKSRSEDKCADERDFIITYLVPFTYWSFIPRSMGVHREGLSFITYSLLQGLSLEEMSKNGMAMAMAHKDVCVHCTGRCLIY